MTNTNYVTSSGNIQVQNPNGSWSTAIQRMWIKTNAGEPIYSTPIFVQNFVCSGAVSAGGLQVTTANYSGPVFIYQSWDWFLYVVNATTGATIWRYYNTMSGGAPMYGRSQYIKIGSIHYIYGAGHNGYVFCLNGQGVQQWQFGSLYNRTPSETTGTCSFNSGTGVFTDSSKDWANNTFCGYSDNANVTVGSITSTIATCSGTTFTVASPGGLTTGSYSYTITPSTTSGGSPGSDIYYQHAGTLSTESGTTYLYVTGFDNQVVKLNAVTGALVWKYSTLQNNEPFPLIADVNNDGVIECIVCSVDMSVYCLKAPASGDIATLVWKFSSSTGGFNKGNGFDGFPNGGFIKGGSTNYYVVAGCRNGRVYSINGHTGALDTQSTYFNILGNVGIDTKIGISPYSGGDNLIMADYCGNLAMLSNTNDIAWNLQLGNTFRSSPQIATVAGQSVIIACDMAGRVSMVSLGGAVLLQFYVKGSIEGTPWIGDIGDGFTSMLITTNDGYVYLYRLLLT
jgi:outer membrane protein assembly factor BamB